MATSPTVNVPVALDLDALVRQLTALRLLASQVGFALDTAILAVGQHQDGADDGA